MAIFAINKCINKTVQSIKIFVCITKVTLALDDDDSLILCDRICVIQFRKSYLVLVKKALIR